MNQSFVVPRLIIVFFIFIRLAGVSAQTAAGVLPVAGSLPGWEASYDVMAYEGEDLFFLINGGADLYMEYGFVDVAAVELKHPEKGSVYIELYRMDSDSAAYGVFSLRKGNLTAELNPASWVVYGDDFLHVWQGPFYMSVSGGRLEKGVRRQVFAALIEYLAEKVPAQNKLPLMMQKHPKDEIRNAIFIMGPLALNNIYNFGHENIFRVSEGIVLEKETERCLVFKYPDQMTAGDTFNSVAQFMEVSGRFSQFERAGDAFSVKDRQNNQITVSLIETRIQVIIKGA